MTSKPSKEAAERAVGGDGEGGPPDGDAAVVALPEKIALDISQLAASSRSFDAADDRDGASQNAGAAEVPADKLHVGEAFQGGREMADRESGHAPQGVSREGEPRQVRQREGPLRIKAGPGRGRRAFKEGGGGANRRGGRNAGPEYSPNFSEESSLL